MLFALPGEYAPAGLFSGWHFLLLGITLALVALGLYLSRRMTARGVRRTIRAVTVLLWVLEAVKIYFVLFVLGSRNPNEFVPLYYCSLVLFAGLFSSLGRGWLRRVGDCFLATGGIVGGLAFLVFPTTSLPRYPVLHFLSMHSFLLHGLMVFVGILLLARRVFVVRGRDVGYCAGLISVMCLLAFVFNTVYRSATGMPANLMFISEDFPGTPVTIVYQLCGKLFPLAMWLIQAFGPFYLVYFAVWLISRIKSAREK